MRVFWPSRCERNLTLGSAVFGCIKSFIHFRFLLILTFSVDDDAKHVCSGVESGQQGKHNGEAMFLHGRRVVMVIRAEAPHV